jgi:dTMP kinase
MRGRFITVEGIEGTGKSTNIDFLTTRIEARGHNVVTSREPGGTPMAEKIRQLLLDHGQEPLPAIAELLLFFAARSLHLQNMILPALDEGTWVISDRFTDASRAYQAAGRGLPADSVETLAGWVLSGLEPDLTILLDAPAEIGMRRAASRGKGDRMDNETLDFYERVREAYLQLADRDPERFVVVNADQPLEAVQREIEQGLDRLFDNK